MRELAKQGGLALEPALDLLGRAGDMGDIAGPDDLDGHQPVADAHLLAQVNLTHAAFADFADQSTTAEHAAFETQHRAPPTERSTTRHRRADGV